LGHRLAPLAREFGCASLVIAHEARIADDVGGKDRGELPGFAQGSMAEKIIDPVPGYS
jgi:hypothetical protein